MVLLPFREVLQFKILTLLLHEFDKVRAIDQLQMPDTPVFVSMFGTVFGIDILAWINLYFKLMDAAFQSTVHDHGHHLGVTVLERLIFYINILRFCPLPDPVSVLPVFRAILGNMNTEKNLAAPRV
jgi:hypothetical protein